MRAFVFSMAVLFSGMAHAKVCTLEISGNDAMQYSTKELTVAADCKTIKVQFKHSGKLPKAAMGHNWVLTEEANFSSMMTAGIQAGLAKDYLPDDKSKIIAATKLLGGGESDEVTIEKAKLSSSKSYVFFCSFPGHAGVMKGKFIVK